MTHVTGAYFSPTGGTKRALEAVCSLFEGEAELLELTGPSKKEKQLAPEDLLVLALWPPTATGTTTTPWPR